MFLNAGSKGWQEKETRDPLFYGLWWPCADRKELEDWVSPKGTCGVQEQKRVGPHLHLVSQALGAQEYPKQGHPAS